jgi:uncharacterized protein
LVEYQADINGQDNDGSTPLHWLASHGSRRIEIIRLFLNHGADVQLKNCWGETPLFNLVGHQIFHPEYPIQKVCELFSFSNSDVNVQLSEPNAYNTVVGDTILHCALRNKFFDEARMILHYHPDLHVRNQNGETALNVTF